MAEYLAASAVIGFTASLVQLAGTVISSFEAAKKYASDIKYASETVQAIQVQLPIQQRTIEECRTRIQKSPESIDQAAINDILNACKEKVDKSLNPLLKRLKSSEQDSKLMRWKRGFLSAKVEAELKESWDRLREYGTTLHQLVLLIPDNTADTSRMLENGSQRLIKYPTRRAKLVESYVDRFQEGKSIVKSVICHLQPAEVTDDSPLVAMLLGMGGAGKTQIALRCCKDLEEKPSLQTLCGWTHLRSYRSPNHSKELRQWRRQIAQCFSKLLRQLERMIQGMITPITYFRQLSGIFVCTNHGFWSSTITIVHKHRTDESRYVSGAQSMGTERY